MRRVLLAAATATAIALAVPHGGTPVHAQARGAPAPEIQITDWINGDGLTQLEDYRGQVVLLEFWNTH